MSNLGPQQQNASFSSLLQVPGGITSTLQVVQDGAGNNTGLLLSSTSVGISGFTASSAQNLEGGTAGSLPYQSASGATSFLAPSVAGYVLTSVGAAAPIWSSITPATIGALPLSGLSAMTGNLQLGGNRITNLGTPSASTDGATKGYVDSIATGLNIKESCVAATTANITLSGAQTIDGVSVVATNRVLVKNQTTSADNGIYVASASAWSRATDADTWNELISATTFISSGTVNGSTTWTCNVTSGGTLGSTPVTFVQFSGSQAYTAGSGLTLVGNQFSLSAPVSVANGGTGISTLTGIAFGNGTSAFTSASAAQIVGAIGSTAVNNATTSTNAVKLQTARTINGVAFDGTANITIPFSGSSMFITVSGFTQAAIDAAITTANANPGSTVFFPAGTYTVVNTIVCSDINIIGVGNATKIIGSSANLGSSNPIFKLSGIINVSSIYTAFDSKPGSATTGQYVIFWLGNPTIPWYGVQRPSYINYIYTGPCGTAFYNPDTSSTNDTSVFSTTFSNLRVEQFTYRGFDFRSLVRTGNVYSNIYLTTGSTGVSPNILTLSCDTLFYLGGGESESSIHQLNTEWATFYTAAIVFEGCSNIAASTIHIEHVTPGANNVPFIKTNKSCGTIQSLTIYGNYYPVSQDPIATGISFFQCNSSANTQNGSYTVYNSNYFNIDVFNLANYPITYSPVLFSRGTNNGSMYINVGNFEYAGNSSEDPYWAAFPTSGNLTFISKGPSVTNPIQTCIGQLNVTNGLAVLGTTASYVIYPGYINLAGGGAQINTTNGYQATTPIYSFWYDGGTGLGSPATHVANMLINGTEIAQWSYSGYKVNNLSGAGNRAVYSDSTGLLTNTSSDISLKKNITSLTGSLDKTKQLRGVSYNWKNSDKMGEQTEIGFIAQEVQQIVPEVIGTNFDGTLSLDYAKLTALLAESVKEILTRLEALESKIP